MLQKLALMLLCMHSFLVHVTAQIKLVNSDNYYEYEYFDESKIFETTTYHLKDQKRAIVSYKTDFHDHCFCLLDSIHENRIDEEHIGYVPIYIPNSDPNSHLFVKNILGENALPYSYSIYPIISKFPQTYDLQSNKIIPSENDNPNLTVINVKRKRTMFVSKAKKAIMDSLLNVDIKEKNYFNNHNGIKVQLDEMEPGYNDDFMLYMVNDTSAYSDFQRVWISMRIGDSISIAGTNESVLMSAINTKVIYCPEQISTSIIETINDGLVEAGYLAPKKRINFTEEVREAMYEFQKDNGLDWGFVDVKTLSLLKKTKNVVTQKKP